MKEQKEMGSSVQEVWEGVASHGTCLFSMVTHAKAVGADSMSISF